LKADRELGPISFIILSRNGFRKVLPEEPRESLVTFAACFDGRQGIVVTPGREIEKGGKVPEGCFSADPNIQDSSHLLILDAADATAGKSDREFIP
jgi:hypothetical protein